MTEIKKPKSKTALIVGLIIILLGGKIFELNHLFKQWLLDIGFSQTTIETGNIISNIVLILLILCLIFVPIIRKYKKNNSDQE